MRTAAVMAIALLAFLSAITALAGLSAKWTYALPDRLLWASISENGDRVFLYSSEGYLYVIDSKGRETAVLRPGPLAKDLSGELVIGSPSEGNGVIYAVTGEAGQVAEYVGSKGEREWSVFLPGRIVTMAISPSGKYIAIALLPLKLGTGEITITVSLINGGKASQPVSLGLGGVTEARTLRVAVSDRGDIALYNPSVSRIQVYSRDGSLSWESPQVGPPSQICMSPDGITIVSVERTPEGFQARVYRVGEGEALNVSLGKIYAIGPECRRAAYYGSNSTIRLVNLETGQEISLGVVPVVEALSISTKGTYVLAVGGYRYTLFSQRGTVGDGFTLSPIQEAAISARGKAILLVDSWNRAYYVPNPEAERLGMVLKMLMLGVAFVAGLILILRFGRRRTPERGEEHEEEIFPE